VIALALTINVWDLSENGSGNLYYSPAARSMTESWHNFFFVAFDSGGFIYDCSGQVAELASR